MNVQTGSYQPAIGIEATGIRRALVIGAGSMGSGIAAQFANAGIAVDLLDIPGTPRNAAAEAGIARQLKVGGFMHPDAARLVRPGNTEDDLARAAEADWIIEVIIENIAAKRDLFTRIEAHRRPGTLISSNTSTLRLEDLTADMPASFAHDFVITHFFNPPRVMQLVEVVGGAHTDAAAVTATRQGLDTILGKTVVDCSDTPGFIANRIGCFWIAMAILEAKRLGLAIEEAEAVNIAFGVPKMGVFGCLDLIGIDLVPHVWGSLKASLLATDALQSFDLTADPLIRRMIAEGRHGRKTKQGFTRPAGAGGFETTDLVSGEYRPARPVRPADLPGGGKDLAVLISDPSPVGRYAETLALNLIGYAAAHGSEIASDIDAIDTAMRLGYGWKEGPFAIADRIGPALVVAKFVAAGYEVPPLLAEGVSAGGFHDGARGPLSTRGAGHVTTARPAPSLIERAKGRGAPILSTPVAKLWDIGEGVACFEMGSKMNCFEPGIFDALEETLARAGSAYQALVLGNDHPRAFSVGADLAFITGMITRGEFAAVDNYIARGQALFLAMKYAPVPVVAAAHGFTLGGGCEFMLHADAVVAHAELTAGLPEMKVGLVPAWGGCTQLLTRTRQAEGPRGPLAEIRPVFDLVLSGSFTGSAAEARARGLLRKSDGIVMSRAGLMAAAHDRARQMAVGYTPPEPAAIMVGGPSAKAGLMVDVQARAAMGTMTPTDVALAEALAEVLTGGPSGDPTMPQGEAQILALERGALIELARRDTTRARIDHMLATGKPLRN